MALIKCSECGAEISSTAAACVKCGAPVAKVVAKKAKGLGCFPAGCLTVFVAAIVLGAIGSMTKNQSSNSTVSTPTNQQNTCDTQPQQRAAAQSMIQLLGYDCTKVDNMCPYVFSEGYTVYCNDFRYKFELENHGGKWSVKAD